MLRHIDSCACASRWRFHSEAVALFCGGLMFCALIAPPLTGAPLVFVASCIAAIGYAGTPPKAYFRALLLPTGFLLTSVIGLCFSLDWSHGFHLTFSLQGANTALQTGLRALAALSVTLLFAFTVPLPQWLSLLRGLRVPEAVLDLILLTYRNIFLLDDGLTAISRAQRNRLGYSDFHRSLRSCGLATGALFMRGITRSMRLERGLAARNYAGCLLVLIPSSDTRAHHFFLAAAVPLLLALFSWTTAYLLPCLR